MPQFMAVQCYKCSMLQVKQVLKSGNKWSCCICNEKQSVRKVYATSGAAKDVRKFVQDFNLSGHEEEMDAVAATFQGLDSLDDLDSWEEGKAYWHKPDLSEDTDNRENKWKPYMPVQDVSTRLEPSQQSFPGLKCVTELPEPRRGKRKHQGTTSTLKEAPENGQRYDVEDVRDSNSVDASSCSHGVSRTRDLNSGRSECIHPLRSLQLNNSHAPLSPSDHNRKPQAKGRPVSHQTKDVSHLADSKEVDSKEEVHASGQADISEEDKPTARWAKFLDSRSEDLHAKRVEVKSKFSFSHMWRTGQQKTFPADVVELTEFAGDLVQDDLPLHSCVIMRNDPNL